MVSLEQPTKYIMVRGIGWEEVLWMVRGGVGGNDNRVGCFGAPSSFANSTIMSAKMDCCNARDFYNISNTSECCLTEA